MTALASAVRVETVSRPPRRPGPLTGAVLLVALLAACWALVSPLGNVPDEPAHVLYAAAVVRGDVGHGPLGTTVDVPSGVVQSSQATCPAFRAGIPADCIADLTGGRQRVAVETSAARYPPLFYALVGWPTWFGFGETTWYVMRLLSVALGLGLLLAASRAWDPQPAVVAAGVLVAASPMAVYLLGSVNPNGAEITAGIATTLGFCGLWDRLRRGAVPLQAALVGVVVPGGYLALARPGTALLLVALSGVLLLAGLPPLRPLWQEHRRVAVAAGGGLGAALVVGVLTGRALARPPDPSVVLGSSLRGAVATVLEQADVRLFETVGFFGWRDHAPPLALRLAWLGMVLVLVLLALLVGSRRQQLALGLLALGGVVLAPFALVLTIFTDGTGYQGRYAMALTQALPVLAAWVVADRTVLTGATARRALSLVPVATVVLGLLMLLGSLLRYAVGLPLPLDPRTVLESVVWLPPAWPLALLLVAAAVAGHVLLARRLRAPA
ncbi:MAG: hypothetical protein JWN17_1802 [Frankiales bacterium]|nr:hypothetical protein [Frankiales bacterium]